MNGAPQDRVRRRKPFQEAEAPKSFLRTSVGLRILLLAILLATAGLMLVARDRRADRALKAAASAAEQAAASAPIAITEAQLAERRQKLATAFEGALKDTVNGDDFIETPGYRKLIEILAGSAPDDVAQRASKYLDHAAAMKDPDLFRGEYVRVRGLLGGLSAFKLESPVHDITDVWRGTIAQPDGAVDTVVIDLVGEPVPVELRRSVVEVEGILYRTVAYESRTGDKREAPYLLARNLHVIEAEETGSTKTLTRLLILVAGVAAIVVYALIRYSLRSKNAPRARRPAGFKKLFDSRLGIDRPRHSNRGPPGS